jgi:hypothetical protein
LTNIITGFTIFPERYFKTLKGADSPMSDFSYEKPDDEKYHQTLLAFLRKKGEDQLYHILKKAKCSIVTSSTFSRKRWNGLYTKIVFQIPLSDFENIDEPTRLSLIPICDMIMPSESGFDIMNVEFTPLIGDATAVPDLKDDLEEIRASLQTIESHFALPHDIMEKGEEMAEVYLYLYAVENSLRLFIEKVGTEKYGPDFFDSFNVPAEVSRGIEGRKKQESKNQWLSIRGDSPLFYLDFKELGTLILNNWELFKPYFPQQSWIATKIDELGNCRNLVAHNSYLGKHERDVIRVNFNSIIKQISSAGAG